MAGFNYKINWRISMSKKVTLADIAEEVGVSTVAVHKALTGKQGVSDGLRIKIKNVAENLGYTNTVSEKAKIQDVVKKTGNIGVIIPEQYYGLSASFYGQLYEQVVRMLYKYECYGILELLTENTYRDMMLPRILQESKVDGVILLGITDEKYVKFLMEKSGRPVLGLDMYFPSISLDTVISDGYRGAYMMTSYLIGNGHRNIGFVGSVEATSSITDRYWGYRKALRENNIEYMDIWEIPDRNGQGETFDVILEDTRELDALVCNCDLTASIVIQNLEDRGYEIPRDISIAGFDDFLPLGMDRNRITTYKVDMETMADVCVGTLIRKINHKKYQKGIQVVSGDIVCKKSVRVKSS